MYIRHLNIEVTKKCNLNCGYCFNESGQSGTHTPYNVSQWLATFRGLKAKGLESIHVTGGEPFMWPGTIDLLAGSQAMGIGTSVLSNGFQILDLLPQNEDAFKRLTVAQISLDSADAEIHDARRGVVGAHRMAVDAIRQLVAHGVPVQISCVVSDDGDELNGVLAFASQFGIPVIARPLALLGRANCQENIVKADIRTLPYTTSERLTTDPFMYVPTSVDHDQMTALCGIWTCLPNCTLRGHGTLLLRDAA